MTEREAIDLLEEIFGYLDNCPILDELNEAISMAEDALEKQIKMRHHHTAIKEVDGKGVYFRFSICPNCLREIISYKNGRFPGHCNWCGHAIDFSDIINGQDIEWSDKE